MQAPSDRFVTLRGGLTVPVEPLWLTIDLEIRGFTLQPHGDTLIIRPFSQLTEVDIAAIQRWKLHLLALLAYEPPTPEWLQ